MRAIGELRHTAALAMFANPFIAREESCPIKNDCFDLFVANLFDVGLFRGKKGKLRSSSQPSSPTSSDPGNLPCPGFRTVRLLSRNQHGRAPGTIPSHSFGRSGDATPEWEHRDDESFFAVG